MAHALAIVDHSTGEVVGHLFVSFLFQRVRRLTLGYCVVSRSRRQGHASEALDFMATYALSQLGMSRLTLYIEPWNRASIATAKRAGFVRDGLLRAWETYDDGNPLDLLAFGRIADG